MDFFKLHNCRDIITVSTTATKIPIDMPDTPLPNIAVYRRPRRKDMLHLYSD